MAKNAIHTIHYRRKREGRTHYKKRLELLKGAKDRLVIRRSNTAFTLQIVRYKADGDKVITTVHSKELAKLGWVFSNKSIPAAYLSGLLLGKKAKDLGVTTAILDIGLQTPIAGSRIYAALKGVVDTGLAVPCSQKIFPSENRLLGKHIADSKAINKTRTKYLKEKADVTKISSIVNDIKTKIIS